MLNQVNSWVGKTFTSASPYAGALDGRITRDGNDTSGSIVPVTILHHNDSHGNLAKGTYAGYTQLATLIKQEKAYNPNRTLLLSGGDNIQGDAMMYYFKSAPLGYAADGTPLASPPLSQPLTTHPMMAVMNSMGYSAMTLGNHEFNFGSDIFQAVLGQAAFPVLGANVTDSGAYGLAAAQGGAGVKPYVEEIVGPEGIKVAILGITNHRVPNYELPSNIPGLAFGDPLAKAQELATALGPTNDAVVALTHIGFTENPASVEVDTNVDTNMAAQVAGIDAIIGSHSHTNPATGFGAYKYLPTIIPGPAADPVLIHQAYRYNNTLGEVFLGFRPQAGGGYELVSRAGQYLSVVRNVASPGSDTPEDAATKAIVDPYVTQLSAYNSTVIGQTTVPIDALQAFTQETNGANLQADASVHELVVHGINPDIHLSGAMTNKAVATSGPYPVTLKVADMFTLMPYENSLVVLEMNGPQLKAVLERAYRNYYYYKYVPGYGGYSYYTTCMVVPNSMGKITYNDLYPAGYDPNKSYVVSLLLPDGTEVDFDDASTYYRVSTVNYLAAGSCNFNNGGVSLWPLDQIVNDTQYYVRDSVIDYITAMGTVSPAVEGRLQFIHDVDPPTITINSPTASRYLHSSFLTPEFTAEDVGPAGLHKVSADLDGTAVANGQVIDLITLVAGDHTLTVHAIDKASNASTASVTFSVEISVASLNALVNRFYAEGKITKATVRDSLLAQLIAAQRSIDAGKNRTAANQLNAFINLVRAQSGKAITKSAADLLISDARWVIAHL
jgi:2',3'-cyclic-nucleotide 2'-phosphodiesterase (5'-nucleotidase family)